MALIKSISGIRGTIGGKVGSCLTPVDLVKFSSAYAMWLKTQSPNKKVVVGRDARISGESITHLVASSLQNMGFDVIDLGLSTTPSVEMAVINSQAAGGIIITASHNPANWNALKLLNADGEFISAADGEWLLAEAEKENFEYVAVGNIGKRYYSEGFIREHIQKILELPLVDKAAIEARNFRIVVDAVNSTGGIAVPQLLQALGVRKVECLFGEPNGHFPHNPEPLPENLGHIIHKIEDGSYDLGIVVDPDVDRLAFVCEDGTVFGEEYSLVAVADYVLSHQKGNAVSNLSSTQALKDVVEKHGGQYFAAAVGEVNVVQKMKECQAVIGGEGNGGIIYPPLHYGRDALVGIALFLSHLAHFGKSIKMLRNKYPNYFISKNKIELTPEIDVDSILVKIKNKYHRHPHNTEDGLKIIFEKEWVHLRKSNTEPIIRIYSESDSQATADYLANKIIDDIREAINK